MEFARGADLARAELPVPVLVRPRVRAEAGARLRESGVELPSAEFSAPSLSGSLSSASLSESVERPVRAAIAVRLDAAPLEFALAPTRASPRGMGRARFGAGDAEDRARPGLPAADREALAGVRAAGRRRSGPACDLRGRDSRESALLPRLAPAAGSTETGARVVSTVRFTYRPPTRLRLRGGASVTPFLCDCRALGIKTHVPDKVVESQRSVERAQKAVEAVINSTTSRRNRLARDNPQANMFIMITRSRYGARSG